MVGFWRGVVFYIAVAELEEEISRAFGILSHLNGVKNSSELRETIEKIQASITYTCA